MAPLWKRCSGLYLFDEDKTIRITSGKSGLDTDRPWLGSVHMLKCEIPPSSCPRIYRMLPPGIVATTSLPFSFELFMHSCHETHVEPDKTSLCLFAMLDSIRETCARVRSLISPQFHEIVFSKNARRRAIQADIFSSLDCSACHTEDVLLGL
jgi:hypothetical protein